MSTFNRVVAAHETTSSLPAAVRARLATEMADPTSDVGASLSGMFMSSVILAGAGIDSTGTTDSTSALQSLITANPGTTLFLPAGTYLTTGLTMAATDTALLANPGSVTLRRTAGTNNLVNITAARVSVRGLHLDGGGSAFPNSASVVRTNAVDTVIAECEVEGAAATATPDCVDSVEGADRLVVRDSIFYGSVTVHNSDDSLITRNKFFAPGDPAAGYGVNVQSLFSGSHANGTRITDNFFRITTNMFAIVPLSRNAGALPPANTIISGNVFVAAGNCYGGISVDTSGKTTVSNNAFRVESGVVSAGALEVVASSEVTATGNVFDGGGTADKVVIFNNSSDCVFVGNSVGNYNDAGTSWGVSLLLIVAPAAGQKSDRNVIAYNTFSLPAQGHAVAISVNAATASVSDNQITGNTIYGTASNTRGVKIDNASNASCTGNIIQDNSINVASYSVQLYQDTNTIIRGNIVPATTIGPIYLSDTSTLRVERNSWQFADAAPTTLQHTNGERVENLTPTPGDPSGWVCTVAGTPGTWVPLASLPV